MHSRINLFSNWEPTHKLRAALKEDGIAIAWRPLHDIPFADLEANRHYTIWDGSFDQGNDFLKRFWSPEWKMLAMKDLVYGDAVGNLVFMTRARAEDLAAMRSAKSAAKTWGDFKRLAPASIVLEVNRMMAGDESGDDDPVAIPGYEDGDWPFPQQEQIQLLPDDVIQLGDIGQTIYNGERLDFAAEREAEIVAKLEMHGFHVERDDKLVQAACDA